MSMSGIFYGIGVGPGDPELMTLKAVRLIKESDCIVLPGRDRENCRAYAIAAGAVEGLDEKELFFFPFPMKMDKEELEMFHRDIADKIEQMLDLDKKVSFLTIGDPSIYSTLVYIKEILDADGYNCELVSGVTSFCASAARLGISLGQGDTPISIIPGGFATKDTVGIPGTRVYMKSGKRIGELREAISAEKKERELDVSFVSNCGMENEVAGHGLDELSDEKGYLTVVIVKDAQID